MHTQPLGGTPRTWKKRMIGSTLASYVVLNRLRARRAAASVGNASCPNGRASLPVNPHSVFLDTTLLSRATAPCFSTSSVTNELCRPAGHAASSGTKK